MKNNNWNSGILIHIHFTIQLKESCRECYQGSEIISIISIIFRDGTDSQEISFLNYLSQILFFSNITNPENAQICDAEEKLIAKRFRRR